MARRRITRASLVACARGWVGTPFRHQAAARGVGCDCVGLIRGVAAEIGIAAPPPEEWGRIGAYGRVPRPDLMGEAIRRHMVPVEGDPKPGDIAWMAWREHLPMHLAFLAEFEGRPTIIHAYEGAGKVVEHGFVAPWPGRVESWWRIPAFARKRK